MLRNRFWTRPPPLETKNSPDDVKSTTEELMIGIWRVLVVKESRFPMFNFQWENISSTFPLLRRAIYDVYAISPHLFALRILTEIWFGIEGPLSLYFSNNLFFSVSLPSSPRLVLTSATRSRERLQEALMTIGHPLACTWR